MSTENVFTCAKCGKSKPVQTSGGTGYAEYPNIAGKVCYQCCGELDRASMIDTGKACLYLTQDNSGHLGAVSNWPGTLSFPLIRYHIGRHNIAGKRYDVWFRGPNNTLWHGTTYGDNTQICHCRRIKG